MSVVLVATRSDRVRALLGAALALGLAGVYLARLPGSPWLLGSAVVWFVGSAVWAARSGRLAVVARGEQLTIRNHWRTRTLSRAELAGFRTGPRLPGGPTRAWAVLRDGRRVPLPAVETRGDLDAMERELAALQRWRAG